jgi:indole-3-acetate monooxygenase
MAVSTADMVAAVGAVAPDVAARADEIEAGRRLPDEVVKAIRDTGINRMAIPAALGGMEAPVAAMIDAVERLSAADGSTGWCTAIGRAAICWPGTCPRRRPGRCSPTPTRGTPPCSSPAALWTATTAA